MIFIRKHTRLITLASLLLILSFLIPTHPSFAANPYQEDDGNLVVAIKIIEPFVIKEGNKFTGFSIDFWEKIALETGLRFEYLEVESVNDQLAAVSDGRADLAIAAISMTPAREESLDFSHPYYRAGMQILARTGEFSIISSLLSFIISSRFLMGFLGLIVIILVIAHFIWLVERRNNPDFPNNYLAGVWEGVWWAAVTLTTVGYGDRVIKDKWGRLMAIFWMFAGLFLLANFTAFVTADVTSNRINSTINDLDDLQGKKVATVGGTTSAEFLREIGYRYLAVDSIEEAYELLATKEIDGILFDAPVLQYHLASSDNFSFQLIGAPFQPDDYGIAMPNDSPYKEDINQAILEIKTTGAYEDLTSRWSLSE